MCGSGGSAPAGGANAITTAAHPIAEPIRANFTSDYPPPLTPVYLDDLIPRI